MSCCDRIPASPEDTVGTCPACGSDVDKNGGSTEEGCAWSPTICKVCGDCPCDQSC